MNKVLLHSINADSRDAKTLYDLIGWGREAKSEYIFHSEIDEAALRTDGTGDLLKSEFYAEVHVSFEQDVFEVEKNKIENSHRYFVCPNIERLKGSTPNELLRHNFGSEYLYISGDSNSCFLMVVNQGFSAVHFVFIKIFKDRVTKIESYGRGKTVTIDEIYTSATELMAKYKEIPYFRFTGAIRE